MDSPWYQATYTACLSLGVFFSSEWGSLSCRLLFPVPSLPFKGPVVCCLLKPCALMGTWSHFPSRIVSLSWSFYQELVFCSQPRADEGGLPGIGHHQWGLQKDWFWKEGGAQSESDGQMMPGDSQGPQAEQGLRSDTSDTRHIRPVP